MMMRILIIRIIIVFIERLLLFEVYKKKRVNLYIDICRIVLDNEILYKICDFI